MKCVSARVDTQDADDLKVLIKVLKLRSAQSVFDIVQNYYPAQQIPAKAVFFIEELFDLT